MTKSRIIRVILLSFFIANCELIFMRHAVFARDKIVAIINNDAVTQKELDDFANFMRMQLSRTYAGKELEMKLESLNADLLNKLIEDRLILQEAKKNKIVIDETRVKTKVDEIKKRYASDAEFQADLMSEGLSQADIEKKIREQLLMFAAVDVKVRNKIIVRPEEVTSFYYKNINEFKSPEERELDVFILESQSAAESFSYNLRIGKKLEELAARYPITENKLKTSEKEELRKEIKEVVLKLGIGEVSRPVKIEDKYYVFRLDNILPSRQESLPDAQEKINAFLFEQKMQEELSKWLGELKKQSYIKIIQ